ncbi:hypothetical protein C2R22_12545 [Salinigranum rubrum]|uniref:C2H2-type domain-containing protein n=1 Tax=Salinigranum rubrum TaxID=755307 RepID=A0A2I8VMQ2_9EURY|nr:hypothetical protein [Salinigranum rubrum]AUV82369.1 hypothetical protein C2R22_12545 [Salinigranum rubrum]
MSLSHRYRQLAALIETLESHGVGVQQAEPLGNGESDQPSDDGFVVQLRVELPADATADLFDVDSAGAVETPGRPPVEPSAAPVGVRPATPAPRIALEGGQPTDASDGAAGHDDTEDATEVDGGSADAAESGTSGSDAGAADASRTGTADDDAELDVAAVVDDDSDGEETGGTGDSSGSDDAESAGDAEATDTATTEDAVPCTHPDCDRTFDTARGMKIHRTKAHPLSELVDGERERAVHRDPDVLARVYDEHDTFAEMTAALDVDVGAQAVRKQMIRHGIHEPGAKDEDTTDERTVDSTGEHTEDDGARDQSASAASDVDEMEEVDETDGVEPDVGLSSGADAPLDDDTPVADRLPDLDLPGSLSTQDLLTAVEEANTLYDVQRALDLDQKTTRDVLTEYDLLELVSGRVAAVGDREELKAEIGQRIRRTAT